MGLQKPPKIPSSPALSQCGWDPSELGSPRSTLGSYTRCGGHTLPSPYLPKGCVAGSVSLLFWEGESLAWGWLGADAVIPHRSTSCFLKSCLYLCMDFPQLWPGLGRWWNMSTDPHL